MKEKYVKCYADVRYIHFIKKHWWSRWEIELKDGRPRVYIRPEADLISVDDFWLKHGDQIPYEDCERNLYL